LFQKVAVRSHVQYHELCGQIGNAIKFTLEGEVKLSVYLGTTTDFQAAAGSAHTKCQPVPNTTLEYRYLHIDVQDTGIGIKPMDMPRLFNKFVQADSSTTRNFGGTGLGLAISKKFVQLMGGRICLESEGLGKGTTCKLYLCIGIYCEPKDIPVTPKRAVSPSTMKNIQVRGSQTNLT
jgi:ethylene receptor